MNKKQKVILLIGGIAIAWRLTFPEIRWKGCLNPLTCSWEINLIATIFQVLAIAIITGVIFAISGTKSQK